MSRLAIVKADFNGSFVLIKFDMTVLNELDRYHLAQAAILHVPGLADRHPELLDDLQQRIAEHHRYVREYGEDVPEVRNWLWPG